MKSTKVLLKQAEASQPYVGYVREQLDLVGVRVRKWMPWDPDSYRYEAFRETRQVLLPIPIDSWSFMVCLHEIGHISMGERVFSYLDEYVAEQWAIKRAKQAYGIVDLDYEKDARRYVWMHIIQNRLFYNLQTNKIKPYVLDWIEATPQQVDLDVKVFHALHGTNSLILR